VGQVIPGTFGASRCAAVNGRDGFGMADGQVRRANAHKVPISTVDIKHFSICFAVAKDLGWEPETGYLGS